MYDLTRFLRPVVDGLAGVLTPAQQTSTLPPELTMRRCSFDFDFENLPRLLRSGSLVGVPPPPLPSTISHYEATCLL